MKTRFIQEIGTRATLRRYWGDACPNSYGKGGRGLHNAKLALNGHHWDIDSRASNCTKPSDTTHRCWVRTGTPPNVTAGKSGNTCSAGAGSILVPGWHGFLTNGELRSC